MENRAEQVGSLLLKYSTENVYFCKLSVEDMNEKYFALLGQLTQTGQFDEEQSKAFFAAHFEKNTDIIGVVMKVPIFDR